MKKLFLSLAALLMMQSAQAKDVVIVIRDITIGPKGKTEIKVDQEAGTEKLAVTPSDDTAIITVSVKTADGAVVLQETLPTHAPGTYEISTPNIPNGCILEIKDNQGVVYSSYEPIDIN